MICITGDTHGLIDFNKLLKLATTVKLTRKDILFILGDVGICWSHSDFQISKILYESIGCAILFIDGNHENFDMLESFPVVTKYDAKMHQISNHIFHILRGEILKIRNFKILCIGGAYSIDQWCRREGVSWWPQEEITKKDIDNAISNLAKYKNKVDLIFTHCLDSGTIWQTLHFKRNESSEHLKTIDKIVTYKRWLFGHYHYDKDFSKKKRCIYQKIYLINKKR